MPELNSFLPFDELDYRILQHLKRDARLAASEIARGVGANERTVRNRIDRLVELGAVRLTAIVEPQVFGYVMSADIFLEVDPSEEERIIECLLNLAEISYLAYGQSANQISIEARFKGNAEFYQFLHHTLPAVPGLRVASYALVPRILRNIDQWLPAPTDFGLPPAPTTSCP